jgi:hypothetical protein
MTKLPALLAAALLCVPVLAQNPPFQGTHPKPRPTAAALAARPILLHTAGPITAAQKLDLLQSAIKASGMKTRFKTASPANGPVMVTPDQMFVTGIIDTLAYSPWGVDFSNGNISFNAGKQSSLAFYVTVQPNTAYVLSIKVFDANTPSPQFTIDTGFMQSTAQNAESFTGTQGTNEFAYGFVSNSAGAIPISIYSSNAGWGFLSAELTASPM